MSAGWTREQMAARAAHDIPDGAYVNLGIGIPELVAQFVPEGREFIYHTENGMLGMGPPPAEDDRDLDLMNAGKKYVTALPGVVHDLLHEAGALPMDRFGTQMCFVCQEIPAGSIVDRLKKYAPGGLYFYVGLANEIREGLHIQAPVALPAEDAEDHDRDQGEQDGIHVGCLNPCSASPSRCH